MTEINSCTKAGQLHESLSQDSACNSMKPSTKFVRAFQLPALASSSGRNSSFVPALKRTTSPVVPENVVIDLTSEDESKTTVAVRKEPPKTNSTGRKKKSDPAVARTKKIAYFLISKILI